MLKLTNEARQILIKAETLIQDSIGYPVKLIAYPQASPYMPHLRQLLAEHYDIDPMAIYGACRKAEVVKARHIYWWVCFNYFQLSLEAIANDSARERQRSNNHTSVMHGVKKIDHYILKDTDPICDSIDVICTEIKKLINSKKNNKYETETN